MTTSNRTTRNGCKQQIDHERKHRLPAAVWMNPMLLALRTTILTRSKKMFWIWTFRRLHLPTQFLKTTRDPKIVRVCLHRYCAGSRQRQCDFLYPQRSHPQLRLSSRTSWMTTLILSTMNCALLSSSKIDWAMPLLAPKVDRWKFWSRRLLRILRRKPLSLCNSRLACLVSTCPFYRSAAKRTTSGVPPTMVLSQAPTTFPMATALVSLVLLVSKELTDPIRMSVRMWIELLSRFSLFSLFRFASNNFNSPNYFYSPNTSHSPNTIYSPNTIFSPIAGYSRYVPFSIEWLSLFIC